MQIVLQLCWVIRGFEHHFLTAPLIVMNILCIMNCYHLFFLSQIIECSKIRPSGKQTSLKGFQSARERQSQRSSCDERARYQRGHGSSRDSHSDQRARTKSSQGSQDSIGDGRKDERSSSRSEDNRKRERRKEDNVQKGDNEGELQLKLENLKKELARLSSEDPGSPAGDDIKVKGHDKTELKDQDSKRRTSSSSEEQLLEPMAFEKQLLKSRTEPTSERFKGQSSKVRHTQGGSKIHEKNDGKGGGKIMIRPEDFQRRHVNQLFVRGDNVVLVSVDKDLLGKK